MKTAVRNARKATRGRKTAQLGRWPRSYAAAALLFGFLAAPASPQTAPLQLQNPLATDTTLDHARALLNAHRTAEADALLRQYLNSHERSAPARYLLGSALVLEDKPKDALAEFTHAAAIQAPNSWDLIQVARAYVLLADYTDAAHWLQKALTIDPADAEAWYNLGRVRYTDQRFADALDCFGRLLTLEPRSVRAENNIGLSLEGLNRTDEAIAAYRQALAWQADSPTPSEQPMINLATVLIQRRQDAEALPLLERAAQVAPRDASIQEPIQEQLGHLYLQQGQFPQAAAAFEHALSLKPNSSALHFLLGQTYRRMGLKAKADEQFQASAAIAGVHSTSEPEHLSAKHP